MDTGIVTPARTLIENQLGVDSSTGIWLITIYTLAYAAAIPVMGKLADRFGRRNIYLLSVALFGIGSLICGLSENFNSFTMLVVARAIQAIGGGGIMPIATAEFGTSVPKEKRGMALGLVGMVYAVANIFGSSFGSMILAIAGQENWQWIFYVNVPIAFIVVASGYFFLPNNSAKTSEKIDFLGIATLVTMILALLYGIRNIDFFHISSSISSLHVWPFFLIFIITLPFFIWIEKRAADPVMNLKFFTKREVRITLYIAFISGVVMMSVVFVPQFAENAMRIPSGSGGYFVIILGLASGIGAPFSGKLTDIFGPRPVLGVGFAFSVLASLSLAFWAVPYPSWTSVSITLALVGLGMGFFMGSPLNYMMLDHSSEKESSSGLATLSLIRSIGTTLAPAIMAGFLTQAGISLQPALMNELPKEINSPQLPHAAELDARFTKWQSSGKISNFTLPKLSNNKIDITPNPNNSTSGNPQMPPELMEKLRSADVTNIAQIVKKIASTTWDKNITTAEKSMETGITQGIQGLEKAIGPMTAKIPVQPPNSPATTAMKDFTDEVRLSITELNELKAGIPQAFQESKKQYLEEIEKRSPQIESRYQSELNSAFINIFWIAGLSALVAIFALFFYPHGCHPWAEIKAARAARKKSHS